MKSFEHSGRCLLRNIILVMIAACFILSLSACIVTDNLAGKEVQEEQDVGAFTISLRDSSLGENQSGDPIITLLLDFKNNEDSSTMYMSAVTDIATQGGVPLVEVPYLEGGSENTDYIVQPGESITVKRSFLLKQPDEDIVFTVEEKGGEDPQKFETIVTPQMM